jgi:ABC-type branched-subunit amino acid transport system substrate-binding protein
MGWKMVSILSCSDSYGTSVANSFLSEAPNQGLSVVGNQVYAPDVTEADVIPALVSIKSKSARIILLSGGTPEAVWILKKAKEMGMVGSDWVWIMPDAGASYFESWDPTATVDLSTGDGIFYVFPREDGANEPYRAFMEKWNAVHPEKPPVAYTMLFMDCISAVARGVLQVGIKIVRSCVIGALHFRIKY